jgi:phosphoribosyl 1,2-cyclic phosphate phosphodiesterase
LKREFHYIFDPKFQYPGIPKINRFSIKKNEKISIADINIEPIEVMHYKLPVLGFKIDGFAYITDAKTIENSQKNKLNNLEVLVINALRIKEHMSHFNLEEAIELIKELKPKKAILTHISHFMGIHQEVQKKLPENIYLAYDGLKVNLNQ